MATVPRKVLRAAKAVRVAQRHAAPAAEPRAARRPPSLTPAVV